MSSLSSVASFFMPVGWRGKKVINEYFQFHAFLKHYFFASEMPVPFSRATNLLSKIMNISLLQYIFSQTVCCLKFQSHIKSKTFSLCVPTGYAGTHHVTKQKLLGYCSGPTVSCIELHILGQLRAKIEPGLPRSIFECKNIDAIIHLGKLA